MSLWMGVPGNLLHGHCIFGHVVGCQGFSMPGLRGKISPIGLRHVYALYLLTPSMCWVNLSFWATPSFIMRILLTRVMGLGVSSL